MKIIIHSLCLVVATFIMTACGTAEETATDESNQQPGTEEVVEWACRTEFGESHEATQGFWNALREDDKASRNQVIADLASAMELHPDEEIFALLHGMASLWKVAEPLPEEDGDMGLQAMTAISSRESLEKAWEICPTDYRITAWLGPILYRMGSSLNDESMIAEGLDILNIGIEKYPEFVLFSKLLIYADEDTDSPDFQNAFAAIQDNMEACSGNEDLVINEYTDDNACSNHFRAAHNVEGSSLFVGDVYAKAGDLETARQIYEQGLNFKDADSWSYSYLLEQRLSDLEAFAQRAPDEVQLHGEGWIWASQVQCAVCHTR